MFLPPGHHPRATLISFPSLFKLGALAPLNHSFQDNGSVVQCCFASAAVKRTGRRATREDRYAESRVWLWVMADVLDDKRFFCAVEGFAVPNGIFAANLWRLDVCDPGQSIQPIQRQLLTKFRPITAQDTLQECDGILSDEKYIHIFYIDSKNSAVLKDGIFYCY
jgi:hypothetical protein